MVRAVDLEPYLAPPPIPRASQRGPLPIRAEDLREGVAPRQVPIDGALTLVLDAAVTAWITQMALDAGPAEGLWAVAAEGWGGDGAVTLHLDLLRFDCAARADRVHCDAEVSLALGSTTQSRVVTAQGDARVPLAAVGATLGELRGALGPAMRALLPPAALDSLAGDTPVVLSRVSWDDDGWRRVGVGLGSDERGWCLVPIGAQRPLWVHRSRVQSVEELVLAGATPGSKVIWTRDEATAFTVHEDIDEGWVRIRTATGLDLLPPERAGETSRLPPRGEDACSLPSSSLSDRVLALGQGDLVSPGRGDSALSPTVRALRVQEGRQLMAGGIVATVFGGISFATSFISPIDACYLVAGPCTPNPQVVVTLPLGALLVGGGVSMIVGGTAKQVRHR